MSNPIQKVGEFIGDLFSPASPQSESSPQAQPQSLSSPVQGIGASTGVIRGRKGRSAAGQAAEDETLETGSPTVSAAAPVVRSSQTGGRRRARYAAQKGGRKRGKIGSFSLGSRGKRNLGRGEGGATLR